MRGRPVLLGLGCSLITNVMWGGQVLFWPLLQPAGAMEMLAYRVVFAALCAALLAFAIGQGREVARLFRNAGLLAVLGAAAGCTTAAWGIYIYAVVSGRVVEVAVGLFLVPLASAATGVLVFRERLRRWQWTAVGLASCATLVIAAGYGRPPWIALSLCVLMALYASLKKRAGVPAAAGFTVECVLATPFAAGYLIWLGATGGATMGHEGLSHALLFAVGGAITAVPLIAHAASINLLPLATVGFLQYLNPTIQFLLGLLVLDGAVTLTGWIGFALIWLALLIYSFSSRAAGVPRPAPAQAVLPGPEARSSPAVS